MKKSTKPNPWDATHKPQCVGEIADFLEISPQRVRQVIKDLKAKPVDRIGNVPFYDYYTWLLIRNRNKKPGPNNKAKSNNRKNGKTK